MIEAAAPTQTGRFIALNALRWLLYTVSWGLYLRQLVGSAGFTAAAIGVGLGMWLAHLARRVRLRSTAALLLSLLMLLLLSLVGFFLIEMKPIPALVGPAPTLIATEALTFGSLSLLVVFLLRLLAERRHFFAVFEVLFVTGAFAAALSDHRNHALNRPRFLSDWAWSHGVDPSHVLAAVGIAAVLVASLLFVRRQNIWKLLTSLFMLLFFGILVYWGGGRHMASDQAVDTLGLSGKNKDNDKGRGNDEGDGPFKDDYNNPNPPKPVAIAILRDDLRVDQPILYFRQRALSRFNGHHLVASPKWDTDLLESLPAAGSSKLNDLQSEAHHLVLPTTMYLLVDHPQPPALSHARQLRAVENPNPTQFVAAYEVESMVLSVSVDRLLGRFSMPSSWDQKRRTHYTTLPADPRYKTLADIILQKLDPRFSGDALAKAFAIKRYLETKGFYTMKSKHSDKQDPTASFLFGSLRGYCVHFAHAAVYLLRTQQIAARVALGYAVQTLKRGGGSSILIMGDRAHAWPEMFVDGVGWVTFDIYPERTDMPPPSMVDYDLEKLLGELARKDETAGVTETGQEKPLPWRGLVKPFFSALLGLLVLCYLVKVYRRWMPLLAAEAQRERLLYRATLDRLADCGLARRHGETREHHAGRIAPVVPSFVRLTELHLTRAFGPDRLASAVTVAQLHTQARRELRQAVAWWRRILGHLGPLSWLRTR